MWRVLMAAKKIEKLKESQLIWMDGKLVPWAEAKVHVLTHSLHYGVAGFQGIPCYPQPHGRGALFPLKEQRPPLFQSPHHLLMGQAFNQEQVTQAWQEINAPHHKKHG